MARAKRRDTAALTAGTPVRLRIPGDEVNGLQARIARGFGLHDVLEDGRRRKRWGYYVKVRGEATPYFATAGQLMPLHEPRKVGHLVVVVDNR